MSSEEPSTSIDTVSAPKKRKADAMEEDTEGSSSALVETPAPIIPPDDEDDDGSTCPICLEPWTSSGEHRISSLRCGHFFGLLCIEKWMKTGNDCPNCNDKATKKDIRPHYVKKLKAIDTGEKDRALKELAETKKELRSLQLEHSALKVTCQLRKEEIEKLHEQIRLLRSGLIPGSTGPNDVMAMPGSSSRPGTCLDTYSRLIYVKRSELFRRDNLSAENLQNKFCKVMAYNATHGMLIVSQPSFTALAPGYGVRRVNMLDRRLESFVALHKEPIRDLAVNPSYQDQLLSVSQDKTVRLTNISNCSEIHRWHCESETWSCAWNTDDPNIFYVGTKRCELLVYDTRITRAEPKAQLQFPLAERRPIISLCYVPKQETHPTFPSSGVLVQTLGSLWFFEFNNTTAETQSEEIRYKAHKLAVNALFWSLKFDPSSRLFLASTKPQPHARHMVCELSRVNVSEDPNVVDFQISTNIIMDQGRGGSFADRAFLRSAICPRPGSDNHVLILYARGSSQNDHKLIIQEVGNDKVIQEIPVDRPIMDVCAFTLNGEHYVTVLSEFELYIYKWGQANL